MFEGDLIEGELEIGQISGLIEKIMPAADVVKEILTEYRAALSEQHTEKYIF
jgi:enoyl-[acyl-carrier protein] reductase II